MIEPMTEAQIEAAIEDIAPMSPEQMRAAIARLVPSMVGNEKYQELLDDAATKLAPMIKTADNKKDKVDARRLGSSMRQIFRRDAPAPEFLVRGLITREGVGAISGEPKVGKSWDALHIATCVASGRPAYGRYDVTEPRGVFYFFAEDTEASIKTRTRAIALDLGLDLEGDWLDRLHAQTRGRDLDLMILADLCVLVASVKFAELESGEKFGLLILDPLSNIHSGEEDKRDSMVKVMARLRAVERVIGCAILFVHHSAKTSADGKGRKRGGQKMRGSSAIHGAVDFGIYVGDMKGDGRTTFEARIESEVKAARGAGTFDRTIAIEDDDNGNARRVSITARDCAADAVPHDLAAERSHRVVKALFDQGGPMGHDDLKRKIGGKDEILRDAINIAVAEGLIERRFVGNKHRGWTITDRGRELVRGGS